MTQNDPELLMERFLKDARESGANMRLLSNARHFLRQLLHALRDTPEGGNRYREATETTIRIIPEDSHRAFLDIIRQFHPYWLGEVPSEPEPAPVAQSASGSQTGVSGALAKMESDPWSRLNIATLERYLAHLRSLDHYGEALRNNGLPESNRQIRLRLMRLLSYTMRDESIAPETFRSSVDKVLAMIRRQENWPIFVSLAREYYYFLANSPEAGQHIQRDISDADLANLVNHA